jgi:hypothetical protein
MKTSRHDQLHDRTESEPQAAKRKDFSDTVVSDRGAGIADILRLRVGCWSPPVHVANVPTAA